MKKILLPSLVVVLLLSLGACGQSVDRAKQGFCQDVGDLGQAAIDLRKVNLTSSKDDLQDAVNDLENALSDVVNSAKDVEEAQVAGVQDAVSDLKNTISDLPDGDLSAEQLVDAKRSVIETMAEIQQISITVCSYSQE
jgi:signal transduction histidine kinase